MRAVMYHYVREPSPRLPGFKFLHVDDFVRQLDWFTENGGFVDRDAFCHERESIPAEEDGWILTFDDGLADHADVVTPILADRGLWGIFYVPTGPYSNGALLDVHRIHYLLGCIPAQDLLTSTWSIIDRGDLVSGDVARFRDPTYRRQFNDDATVEFKRLMNYFLTDSQRRTAIDALWERFLPEPPAAEDFYATPEKLRAMRDAGQIIGSHSVTHRVLSRLTRDEQRSEIDGSISWVRNEIGPQELTTFCYPYGGFHSFDGHCERYLEARGCRIVFNVEQRDITPTDLKTRPTALPRYDCNQLPHGAVYSPSAS